MRTRKWGKTFYSIVVIFIMVGCHGAELNNNSQLSIDNIHISQGKKLPAIETPPWNIWNDSNSIVKDKMAKNWQVLINASPDQKYKNKTAEDEAKRNVDAAYKVLFSDPKSAYATGIKILRTVNNDYDRLMIALILSEINPEKSEPFLIWAMANSSSIDEFFSPMFQTAFKLAEKREPKYLSAIFLILRAKEGMEYLPLHYWSIPTHECVFYVLGRYGREVIPYLYPMLKDKDPYVRRNAAFALGYFGESELKQFFIEMLKAKDIASGGAAFALGEIGDSDTIKPIASLLSAKHPDIRFWSAYALYEIGSKEALPFIEKAIVSEQDERVRQEMGITIKYLKSDVKPFYSGAKKLNRKELKIALEKAKEKNGLYKDFADIAVSANVEDIKKIEEIRTKTMSIASDMGNKYFKSWTSVIKYIRKKR